jgi:CRP/FNR family transcriptional activator FtrB
MTKTCVRSNNHERARAMWTANDLELAAQPVIGTLPASSRAELLRNAVLHSVTAGTVLFEQGEAPNFQHILLSGSVHLLGRAGADREVLIEVVDPPDLVVPAAVMTGSPYLMRAQTPEPSRLLLIHAATFRALVSAEPKLAMQVIDSLAVQYRRLVRQIKSLKLRSTTARAGCYLLALSARQGTPGRALLPYGKGIVASELGMTRESFSRALASLSDNCIAVHGDAITIRNAKRLAAACELDPLLDDPLGSVQARKRSSPKTGQAKRTKRPSPG